MVVSERYQTLSSHVWRLCSCQDRFIVFGMLTDVWLFSSCCCKLLTTRLDGEISQHRQLQHLYNCIRVEEVSWKTSRRHLWNGDWVPFVRSLSLGRRGEQERWDQSTPDFTSSCKSTSLGPSLWYFSNYCRSSWSRKNWHVKWGTGNISCSVLLSFLHLR